MEIFLPKVDFMQSFYADFKAKKITKLTFKIKLNLL